MEFVLEGAVKPGQPDETEDDSELAEHGPGEVVSKSVRGAGDNHDEHEVVEELEEADGAFFDRVVVGSGPAANRSGRSVPACSVCRQQVFYRSS